MPCKEWLLKTVNFNEHISNIYDRLLILTMTRDGSCVYQRLKMFVFRRIFKHILNE